MIGWLATCADDNKQLDSVPTKVARESLDSDVSSQLNKLICYKTRRAEVEKLLLHPPPLLPGCQEHRRTEVGDYQDETKKDKTG